MNDEPVLPHRLTLLGEAMHPLWLKLREQIDTPIANQSALESGMTETISRHLDDIQGITRRLADRVNDLMADVVSNEHVSDADVYRAVGRLEASLDDLAANYHGVRALTAYGAEAEARDLLAGVYRHELVEIGDWLGDLVETLADPISALKKRGLPVTGQVELPLDLTLTAAPQLDGLIAWIERQSALNFSPKPSFSCFQPPVEQQPSVPYVQRRNKPGLGFWGSVGVIVLGLGISDALFGDDDCSDD